MSGFSSPNYTQTPNDLFDSLMAGMTDAELRVVLVAVRLTLGFHKRYDAISLTKFQNMTGLSRQGVVDGVAIAIEHGLLREVGQGKRGVKLYELVISNDQSTELTSQGSDESTGLYSTSQASRHTKERLSKKDSKRNKESVSDETAGQSPSVAFNGNGSGEQPLTPPVPPAPSSPAPKRQRALDPMFEAIAAVWQTRAGGYVGSMKAMFLGTAKKGEWKAANFEPPATADEILAFGKYAEDRRRRDRMSMLPTKPETIQRWFYDYRTSRDRAGLGPVTAPQADETPDLKPLSLDQARQRLNPNLARENG